MSLARRLGVALPIGALALAALLLGAKLVRETPAQAEPLIAASAPAKTKPAAAHEAPVATRSSRRVASTRDRKLRSTPPSPAPAQSKAPDTAKRGDGWVIRRE
jgi:hypothetical protein